MIPYENQEFQICFHFIFFTCFYSLSENYDNNAVENNLQSKEQRDISEYLTYPVNDNTEEESPEYIAEMELYRKCEKEAMDKVVSLASEMREKHWENIEAVQGPPERYKHNMLDWEKLGITMSEAEKNIYAYTMSACVGGMDENPIYIVIILAFTKDNTKGEIYKVYYRSSEGKEWIPSKSYAKNEIVDAYNLDMWKAFYLN